MYIESLLKGLIKLPKISEFYKKKSEEQIMEIGLNKFIKEISSFDLEALNSISKNDSSRLRRVWEVYTSNRRW